MTGFGGFLPSLVLGALASFSALALPPPGPPGKPAARPPSARWGYALQCKPIPDLPRLPSPQVVISLDGLTLHLFDPAAGFDRVYAIGVGEVRHGRTLTPTSDRAKEGLYHANLDWPAFRDKPAAHVRWAWNYECRFWWYDKVKHALLPVYAGLPYIRLESTGVSDSGIHGPAEQYRQPDGGRLRRGYVSHGCVRMEPQGILDVYARTRGQRFPVRIQREIERRPDGLAVDVADRWILSECRTDADCNFEGGVCHANPGARNGFCTMACEGKCPERTGYPGSFCVADPDAPDRGMCTAKATDFVNQCKRFDGFKRVAAAARFGTPRAKAPVCLPGGARQD